MNDQSQQLTECSRQHISPTTSMTTQLQDYTNHKELALCGDIALVGPSLYSRYTSAVKDGRPWVAQKHHRRLQAADATQLQFTKKKVYGNSLTCNMSCIGFHDGSFWVWLQRESNIMKDM